LDRLPRGWTDKGDRESPTEIQNQSLNVGYLQFCNSMLRAIKMVDADMNQDVRYAQEGRMPSMRCAAPQCAARTCTVRVVTWARPPAEGNSSG
jgi:hypothetical protein